MKSNLFSSFLLTAFVLVLSVGMISAALPNLATTSPAALTQSTSGATTTFTLTNNEAFTVDVTIPATLSITDGTNSITVTPDATSFTLAATGGSRIISLTRSTPSADFETGAFRNTLNVYAEQTGTPTVNETKPITVEFVESFCSAGTQGATDLSFDVSIDNNGEGEEDSWHLLDDIEIEVQFNNDRDNDSEVEDVNIELGLFDEDGKNVAEDLIWKSSDDEQFDARDVEDGEDTEHTFNFEVSNELEDGDYILMIKTYSDGAEATTCLDSSPDLTSTYYESISIERESDDEKLIAFRNIEVEPSTSACGGEVTVTAKVYNLGDTEQDAVKVFLYNKALGVDLNEVIENFDTDESKTVEFSFKVPANLSEGLQTLNLYAKHDYDKDDDKDNSDDIQDFDDASFSESTDITNVHVTLQGSCTGSIVTGAAITAELSEDTPKAVIGKQVIVQATIENTGNAETTYAISVSGVSGWATAEIDPATVTVAAGESETVDIYLDIDSDAEEGEQEFTIKATYGSASKEQDVLVTLEKGGLFSGALTGNAIIDHIKSNGFIYTVVIVDLILIIAIIIAVRRIVGRKQ